MKYPRENILDPRNTHEKNFRTHEGTMARWHQTHDGMRPTEFSTLISDGNFSIEHVRNERVTKLLI